MKQSRIYGVCLMLVLAVLWWASISTAEAGGRPFITKWKGEAGKPLVFQIMGEYKLVIKKDGKVVKTEEHLVQHYPDNPYAFVPSEDGEYTVEAGPEGVENIITHYEKNCHSLHFLGISIAGRAVGGCEMGKYGRCFS